MDHDEIVVREEWRDDRLTMWVDARRLHAALGVGKDFSTWFRDRCEVYGFVEGRDYSPVLGNIPTGPGKPKKDYELTLDMAKELAMVEKTDKGAEARQYFLKMERRALGLDLIGHSAKETLANVDRALRAVLVDHEQRLDAHDQAIDELRHRPVIQPRYRAQDVSILRIKFDRALKNAVEDRIRGMNPYETQIFFQELNGSLKRATGRKRDTWAVEHFIIAVEWLLENMGINIAHIVKDRHLEDDLPLS